jgi:hemoglobin-like flavoprotein
MKRIPNWASVAGEQFTRKIFELDPDTITMFGFHKDTKHDDPKLSEDKAFMAKSIRLVKAVDIAVGCLGPDLAPLETQLYELGARHIAMNCRPHHWPVVGKALMHVFDECVTRKLSPEDREAWVIIYNFLSYHMVRGLVATKPCLAGTAPLPEESLGEVLTTPAPNNKKSESTTSTKAEAKGK